ncbi:hypothetical protein SVAN01_06043 [Stagonosporopsis vannaccii]|nr:hypothetical protein SVAN01_06043 [Stagonosporopsis vannaccii]
MSLRADSRGTFCVRLQTSAAVLAEASLKLLAQLQGCARRAITSEHGRPATAVPCDSLHDPAGLQGANRRGRHPCFAPQISDQQSLPATAARSRASTLETCETPVPSPLVTAAARFAAALEHSACHAVAAAHADLIAAAAAAAVAAAPSRRRRAKQARAVSLSLTRRRLPGVLADGRWGRR